MVTPPLKIIHSTCEDTEAYFKYHSLMLSLVLISSHSWSTGLNAYCPSSCNVKGRYMLSHVLCHMVQYKV